MAEYTRTVFDYNGRIKLNDTATDPTEFILVEPTTFFDTVAQNTEEPRATDVGILDYGIQLGKGIAQVPVELSATTLAKMNELVANVKKAFDPDLLEADPTYGEAAGKGGFHPLKWTEFVGSTSRDFQVFLKSTEIPKIAMDKMAGLYRPAILKLKAQDPRKYLQTATTLAGAGTITNVGDAETPVIITITASGTTSTSLTITNSTRTEAMVISTALTTGQVLVIDTRMHSVKLGGVERRDYLSATSKWIYLSPGANVIAITNGSNCSVVLSANAAWPL